MVEITSPFKLRSVRWIAATAKSVFTGFSTVLVGAALLFAASQTTAQDPGPTIPLRQYLDNGGALSTLAGATLVGARGQRLGTVRRAFPEELADRVSIVVDTDQTISSPDSRLRIATVAYGNVRVSPKGDT